MGISIDERCLRADLTQTLIPHLEECKSTQSEEPIEKDTSNKIHEPTDECITDDMFDDAIRTLPRLNDTVCIWP